MYGLFDSRNESRYNHVHYPTKIGGTLDTQRIVSELIAERNRLDRAIAALDGESPTRSTVAINEPSSNAAQTGKKRRGLTAAGRKRLSMLMKKRWAEKRRKDSVRPRTKMTRLP
jgi:hypothetical protein